MQQKLHSLFPWEYNCFNYLQDISLFLFHNSHLPGFLQLKIVL